METIIFNSQTVYFTYITNKKQSNNFCVMLPLLYTGLDSHVHVYTGLWSTSYSKTQNAATKNKWEK